MAAPINPVQQQAVANNNPVPINDHPPTDQDMNDDNSSDSSEDSEVGRLRDQLAGVTNDLNEMRQLLEETVALQATQANTNQNNMQEFRNLATTAATGRDAGEILKPNPPEPFDGTPSKLATFLTQCKAFMIYYPTQFGRDSAKTMYAAGRLKGMAAQWFQPIMEDYTSKPESELQPRTFMLYNSYSAFENALKQAFGTVNEKGHAERRIKALRQTKSASEYAAEYQQLASKLPWDQDVLMSLFFDGLKETVQAELFKTPRPATLVEYIGMAVQIDDYQFTWRTRNNRNNQGRQGNKPRYDANQGRRRQNDTSYGTEAGPMNVNMTKKDKSKVTCYNCGKKGHYERECKNPVKTNQKYRPVPEDKKVNTIKKDDSPQMAVKTVNMARKDTYDVHSTPYVQGVGLSCYIHDPFLSEKETLDKYYPNIPPEQRPVLGHTAPVTNNKAQCREETMAKRRNYEADRRKNPEYRQKESERKKEKRRQDKENKNIELQWTPVPETERQPIEGKTIHMVRKGKEIDPDTDDEPSTKEFDQKLDNALNQIFTKTGAPVKIQNGTIQHNPYSAVDEIPTRVTTERPNRHFRDPNYAEASRVARELDTKRIKRKEDKSVWTAEITPQYDETGHRYWTSKQQKYAELARERAITEQDDSIYIRAYTKKEAEDPATPEERIQVERDPRRYPNHLNHKQVSWISCTRHYCTRHRQEKEANDCFPVQINEHQEQRPYLIIDALGYQVTRRYRGSRVVKLEAHTETRERALNYIQNSKHIEQWRKNVQQNKDNDEENLDRGIHEAIAAMDHLENDTTDSAFTPETNQATEEWKSNEQSYWDLHNQHQQMLYEDEHANDCTDGEGCCHDECDKDSQEPGEQELPEKALRMVTKETKRTCLTLNVRIKGKWLRALVDSGADMNVISPNTVNELRLPWRDKKKPYTIRNGEGETYSYEDGEVTREIDHLKVFVNEKNQGINFDIVPIGDHDLILGYPWLTRYNPQVNWRTGQVNCEDHPSDDDDDSDNNDTRSQTSTDESSEVQRDRISPIPKGTRHKYGRGKTKHVRRMIRTLKGQFTKLDQDLKEMKQMSEKESNERLKNVPIQYRIYKKLFAEELETKLPKHSQWDIEIVLKDGKSPKFFPIYNLAQTELTTLKEWLEDMLRKGHIRTSKSSAGYPVMFVPKPNTDKLRLVVDYRQLNEITEKDRTPLPLITELKDRLFGKQFFTALDLKAAYNLIRIKEGDEWKTAFRTKYGLFEYLVMPFGLTNAPAVFQRMITNVLREYLDIFVVCYLDDILIFSDTEEEHTEHVHKVLKALQDANMLVEPTKSHFHQNQVTYLGHEISYNEIRMDRRKIAAVAEWKPPESVKEVQSFLGFANYYRRFIKNFSKIAIPLTELTKKDTPFRWNSKAQQAFEQLKEAITSEPVLIMFNPDRQVELETDASDFALGGQVGQRDDNKVLHPIAFYSYKMHGAELNYPIYDKEFLAIVNCFKEFRHYLRGSKHPVKVFTDHKNIAYFATTQELNRRQLRYAEYLCEFDFTIAHCKGTDNGRADAISRRPDFNTGTTKTKERLLRKNKQGELQFTQPVKTVARMTRTTPRSAEFMEWMNSETEPYSLQEMRFDHQGKTVQQLRWVPKEHREELVRDIHEHPLHGHPGVTKTLKRVQEKYRMEGMKEIVKKVIKQCDLCLRTKAQRHKPYGQLQPLPVAQRPWDSITMDFITKLPLSEEPSTGIFYDSIMVIVDRLTKFSYYLPYREATDAEELSYVFYRHIVSVHGLPTEILSDRGPTFAATFWQSLMARLGLNHRLTTAFRPSVDGQTERMNQVLEQYLRCYINYEQNDWVEKLPIAQLAYNTAYNESTKLTPAYANFGFTPDAYHDARQEKTINPAAIIKSDDMKDLHEYLRTELEFVRKRMKNYYDPKRLKGPTFSEGDMVYLATKNIKTDRPTHKLDYKFIGPYKLGSIQSFTFHYSNQQQTRYKSKQATNPKKFKDQKSTKQKQSET
ncbi:reverse transcriptase domain-containing protein [Fusarium globosum]|uniref:Reverse transcriptase domain-containing protein n=1 Tax=Fusarium globosum TaxID=78864 RepID=A0A8H5XWC6_9HYPO|nr:reverse transcriptase domain-containing protein [Fusarium globosum]